MAGLQYADGLQSPLTWGQPRRLPRAARSVYPNERRAESGMPNDRIVGIDLGTTNSLVAFMQGDTPVVIPGEDGLNLVPSVVALGRDGHVIVGSAARKYLIETPERAVYSIKRLMGRGVEDVQEELKLFPFRLAEDLQA